MEEKIMENHNDRNHTLLKEIIDNHYNKLENKHLYIESFVYPFAFYVLKKIEFNKITVPYDSKKITDSLDYAITEELVSILIRTLVLELHIKKIEISEELASIEDNNNAHYYLLDKFINNKNNYYEFFNRYDQLLKIVVSRMEFFIENINTLFERLSKDEQDLKKILKVENIFISSISLSEGDSHDNGKKVCRITFNDNNNLIYKPRNTMISIQMHEFQSFIQKNLENDFFYRKIISKTNYSYEEFVKNKEVRNKNDINKYYYNFGINLAIAYSLRTTDIHYENLIAYEKTPVIIDGETFFHPYYKDLYKNFSVGSTSMISGSDGTLNVSALSGDAQNTNMTQDVLLNKNDSDFYFSEEIIKLESKANIPKYKGENIKVNLKYKEELIKGFKDCISFIKDNEDDVFIILEQIFTNEQIRIIFRPTMYYHEIINKMTHPDHISKKDIFTTFIKSNLLSDNFYDAEIQEKELESILNYDIPYFTTYLNSTDIYYRNNKMNSLKLSRTPFEIVKDFISSIDQEVIDKQVAKLEMIEVYE